MFIKAEMKLARWRGHEPKLISISGTLDVPGAQIQALDSKSGWATLTDEEGKFVLPDVIWYPGASYDLVIAVADDKGRLTRIAAPQEFPPDGIFRAEGLSANQGQVVDLASLPGIAIISYEVYDVGNREYYKNLFEQLTVGKGSDEEKVGAINDYVATKLNYNETQWELETPRRVLESGSQYCGHLSSAMETLLASGNYKTRTVNVSDGKNPPATHVVVEVFFGEHWHLYDPTFGVTFREESGEVADSKEVRLNTNLIKEDLLTRFEPRKRQEIASLLRSVYSTGYHHYYYLK